MVIIFISGIVIGVCGTGYFIKTRIGTMRHGTVIEKHQRMMKVLRWKLALSDEQEEIESVRSFLRRLVNLMKYMQILNLEFRRYSKQR